MNVALLLRCIASPKHPQSLTGLKMNIIRVRRVKNEMNPSAIFEKSFIRSPFRIATPTRNSAVESSMPEGMERKSMNPRWNAPRYSFILSALPIGSMAFRNPESINRIPNANLHIALKSFICAASR